MSAHPDPAAARGSSETPGEDDESRPGHGGFANGMGVIGFAIALNFLLDAMDPETIDGLHPMIRIPFESGGKLGVTCVLCLIGVMMIAWDLMHRPTDEQPVAAPSTGARRGAVARRAKPKPAIPEPPAQLPQGAEVYAEELPEEQSAGPKKILAVWGASGSPAVPPPPAEDRSRGPEPRRDDKGGGVVLETAKYLNYRTGDVRGGESGDTPAPRPVPGGFRKGRTKHTRTE